jgi:hypothetical protein
MMEILYTEVPKIFRTRTRSYRTGIMLFCTILLIHGLGWSFTSSVAFDDSVFQIGEELTYNVSYLSFDLGQIRIKQVDILTKDNRTLHRLMAYIDSYKGVPFVDLHAIYESLTDHNNYSTWFQARDKKDSNWISTVYNFNYPKRTMTIEQGIWKTDKITKRDTLRVDTVCQDGLSLFFLARHQVLTRHEINIPVLIGEKKGNTYINFTGERTDEKIDAVDYPIDVVHFEGEAGFIGIFGLSGGFEGWFSNDAARVPILAKMKVLLGNVRIELMSWKRNGWNPPRYHE